jgi:hypothetical protein
MGETRKGKTNNQQHLLLEAEMGVEPIHVGFADQCLPTWLLRRCRQSGKSCGCESSQRGEMIAIPFSLSISKVVFSAKFFMRNRGSKN